MKKKKNFDSSSPCLLTWLAFHGINDLGMAKKKRKKCCLYSNKINWNIANLFSRDVVTKPALLTAAGFLGDITDVYRTRNVLPEWELPLY